MLTLAFRDTLSALRQPAIRRLGFVSVLLTIALLVAAWALLLMLQQTFGPEISGDQIEQAFDPDHPFNSADPGLLALLGLDSILMMLIASVMLMVPVAAVFAALFLGEIAAEVEAQRWAWPAPDARLQAGRLKQVVNFTGFVIAANCATVLLVLFLLPLFGIFALALWYGVNGWLLGRDYFTLVARRRLGPEDVARLATASRGRIWLAGCLLVLPLSLPLVNLAMPFLGGLWFTHIVHRARTGW